MVLGWESRLKISSYFAFAISVKLCFSVWPKLFTRSRKIPNGCWSNLYGTSYSLAYPFSITSTMSESIMVCRRWAMVRTVQSANFSRMVFWISASVFWSMFAVASSSRRTLLFLRMARARQMSCRCPTEKLLPPPVTINCKPFIAAFSSTTSSALHIWSSW